MRQLRITKSITDHGLDQYLIEISRTPLLSSEEEVILAQRIKKGDQTALEKLTKANLLFVVSVAKQYQNQGLIRAAEKFDETRGFKFISCAVWWVRQSIMLALAEQPRVVRLPMTYIG